MNNWPKWFPYPISWLRGFALTYALTVSVKSQLPHYGDSILAILVGAWTTIPFLFTFFHWVIDSIGRLLLAHLPSHSKLNPVRQYLADRFSGRRSHWREGLNALIVSFVAFVVTVLVLAYFLPVPSRSDIVREYENDSLSAYNLLFLRQNILYFRREMIPIGMLIISPYLYQYDLWVRQRRATKKQKSSPAPTKIQKTTERSPKTPPPDPVDLELDRLRAESGMARVKKGRSIAPNPEVAEWYVFRSGQAEGPYTKLQLLEVQQITARTKVKRGEAQWQRAGEIPELEAYLTQK